MEHSADAVQVFISVKNLDDAGNQTRDVELARELHQELEAQGIASFLSVVSLEAMGVAEYKGTIDDALDQAEILIAVGTSPENLTSRWVRYEWDSFFNDIISGIKPEAKVFSLISGFEPSQLPRALRQNQTFEYEQAGIEYLRSFLTNALDLKKAIQDRDQEEALRMSAEHEASVAKEVSEFLVKLFENTDPMNAGSGGLTARELLDTGSMNLQHDLQKQPLVRAKLLKTMGDAYCGLGAFDSALHHFDQAIEIQAAELKEDDESLLQSRIARAWLHIETGEYDQALLAYKQLGVDSDWDKWNFENAHPLVTAINDYGVLLLEVDRLAEAIPVLRRAVEIARQLGPREDLAVSLQNLALALPRVNNQESAQLYDEALEIAESNFGPTHPQLIVTMSNAAKTHTRLGNRERGMELLQRATSIVAEVYDADHPYAGQMNNTNGLIYYQAEEYEKALGFFIEATRIWLKAYGENSSSTAASLQHQARCYKKLGDLDKSRSLYARSVAAYNESLGPENSNTLGPYIELAEVLVDLGENEPALPLIHHVMKAANDNPDANWADGALKLGTELLARIEPLDN